MEMMRRIENLSYFFFSILQKLTICHLGRVKYPKNEFGTEYV
jgi:hypothetical protein